MVSPRDDIYVVISVCNRDINYLFIYFMHIYLFIVIILTGATKYDFPVHTGLIWSAFTQLQTGVISSLHHHLLPPTRLPPTQKLQFPPTFPYLSLPPTTPLHPTNGILVSEFSKPQRITGKQREVESDLERGVPIYFNFQALFVRVLSFKFQIRSFLPASWSNG